MARNIDLTSKLGLGGRPTITIGDDVLEVNDGAQNLLRIMEIVDGEGGMTPKGVFGALELLFDRKGRKVLEGLNFADTAKVVEAALELAMGTGDGGNAETPATT